MIFDTFWKPEMVITRRGVKNFNRKPQLVGGGGGIWSDTPKISFRNRPVSSINSGHTNIYTSSSFSVASRRITPSQRPLRDLCSLVFGATHLKKATKNIIFEISMLDYPIWSLESS